MIGWIEATHASARATFLLTIDNSSGRKGRVSAAWTHSFSSGRLGRVDDRGISLRQSQIGQSQPSFWSNFFLLILRHFMWYLKLVGQLQRIPFFALVALDHFSGRTRSADTIRTIVGLFRFRCSIADERAILLGNII